jgi:alanine racemase
MATPTLTINTNQIHKNIMTIRSTLSPHTHIFLIAKANAYGLGAVKLCQMLAPWIDGIGVATVTEAVELRDNGIQHPILLLTEPPAAAMALLATHDLISTVYNLDTITHLNNYAKTKKIKLKTHFKIDTGMSRLGAPWDDTQKILDYWDQCDHLIKDGVYSHLANSHNKNHPLNQTQYDRFIHAQKNHSVPYTHMANSDAIRNIPNAQLSMVRVGLAAYDNALTLVAPVRHIQYVKDNTSIGYGSTFITQKNTRVGVIGMGYADGLSTQLSNNGYVVIQGHKCPIIGSICMDMIMVQLPENITVNINDPAIILSPKGHPGMSIHDMAKHTHQNPREVMTRFSRRVLFNYQ